MRVGHVIAATARTSSLSGVGVGCNYSIAYQSKAGYRMHLGPSPFAPNTVIFVFIVSEQHPSPPPNCMCDMMYMSKCVEQPIVSCDSAKAILHQKISNCGKVTLDC